MSNGVFSTLSVKVSALLAAVIVSINACDAGTPQMQPAAVTAAPAVRYQPDPARHRVWALTAEGASVHEAASPDGVDIALPGWQWVDAPYACLPALALAPDGAALITSNVVPTVWRIDPVTLAVSVHRLTLDADNDKDVGFAALVYSPRHATYFAVSDVHGSLWRIDPQLTSARKIRLSTPLPKACALAVDARSDRERTTATDALCLRGIRRSWTLRIARDQRSASVGIASCQQDLQNLGQTTDYGLPKPDIAQKRSPRPTSP